MLIKKKLRVKEKMSLEEEKGEKKKWMLMFFT